VTALRTFSISAGLDASTVTPGSTAPDESRTTPAMVPDWPWAYADVLQSKWNAAISAAQERNRVCHRPTRDVHP
jgi:hypothetical protein